jgi:hypothetical protein
VLIVDACQAWSEEQPEVGINKHLCILSTPSAVPETILRPVWWHKSSMRDFEIATLGLEMTTRTERVLRVPGSGALGLGRQGCGGGETGRTANIVYDHLVPNREAEHPERCFGPSLCLSLLARRTADVSQANWRWYHSLAFHRRHLVESRGRTLLLHL